MSGITNRDENNNCIICQAAMCACGGPTTTTPVDERVIETRS